MTHFGILCPTASGHIYSLLPLGKELQKRGHKVTCFLTLDGEEMVQAAGLDFQAIARPISERHISQNFSRNWSITGNSRRPTHGTISD